MMRGQVALKALAVLLSCAGFAFMVAWYGFLEPSWLSYPEGSMFEPVRDTFRPGDVVALKVSRCNSSEEPQLYLIGSRLIRLDQPADDPDPPAVLAGAPVLIQPGCLDEVSKANVLPPDTKDGVYFIQGLSKTDGRWKSANLPWSSARFKVRAASAPLP
jgi:hypothetical protein